MLVRSPRLLLVLYVAVARNLIIVMPHVHPPDRRMTVADSEVSWRMEPPTWPCSLMHTDACALLFLPVVLTNLWRACTCQLFTIYLFQRVWETLCGRGFILQPRLYFSVCQYLSIKEVVNIFTSIWGAFIKTTWAKLRPWRVRSPI